ncbi:hypothetical protein, partial [Thiohalocapsa sp.]|uniref:hypothetical protein n=1 Tax=Thiohalocapsa sp. TaxID=2497641 RepID=UPI0025FB47C6
MLPDKANARRGQTRRRSRIPRPRLEKYLRFVGEKKAGIALMEYALTYATKRLAPSSMDIQVDGRLGKRRFIGASRVGQDAPPFS